MQNFVPGQRWINNAELQLGLGTVVSVEQRTTTILFQASGQTRNYSINTAPLTRVIFAEGDVISNHEGRQITIESIEESDGLLTYTGRDDQDNPVMIAEPHIDNLTQLNRPKDRLFTGQIDDNKWFTLRYQTLQALNHISHSSLIGLSGCRTDLIPHQLYIADEVARRHAPRVLLADEVGLGKTIEAGMIIHQQLFSGQIQRVLIIVPENLLHQWLVEMLRRFNLRFSLFDHERYDAMTLSADGQNPFHNEQLVLCSLDSLVDNPQYFADVLHGEWDMLVVDEAHHLHWQPDHASDEYRLVEQLAAVTQGVLLLTATPEQLGKAGHYARLRILDPARFPDFQGFIEEEKTYEPVARAVDNLFNADRPDQETVNTLARLLGDDMPRALDVTGLDQANRDQLITKLLDRHGTGRVLFRNTRQAIKGFPER
ncbi:MAG: RNA polymerase-associated protein RapA, partial [Gammaproteobacteria bacterium]